MAESWFSGRILPAKEILENRSAPAQMKLVQRLLKTNRLSQTGMLLLFAGVLAGVPCKASTFGFTQLCWQDPATQSLTDNLDGSATADCTSTGSANVVTSGPHGDQTFVGSASAVATPGVWKVSADISLTNYMRDMYQCSTTSSSTCTWPTQAVAGAEMSDSITVNDNGGPGVYSLSYIFSLDGTLTASDQSDFSANFCASVFIPEGVATSTSYCLAPGQTVPDAFTLTYSDLQFGAPVTPTITVEALGVVFGLDPILVGTADDTILNADVNVDFASTVELTSVLITDANGTPIPGVTISSGEGYRVSPRCRECGGARAGLASRAGFGSCGPGVWHGAPASRKNLQSRSAKTCAGIAMQKGRSRSRRKR